MKNIKMFDLSEWDNLVQHTYKRVYAFQQQGGCQDRGLFKFTVPDLADDYENDTVPEVVNHDEMGVSFKAWRRRDPKAPLDGNGEVDKLEDQWAINLWWERNFYPNFQTVANDLHQRGLLPAGNYGIDINW